MINDFNDLTKAEVEEIVSNKRFQRSCKVTCAREVVRILKRKNTYLARLGNGEAFFIQTKVGQPRRRCRMFFRMSDGKLELIN